MQIIGHRGAAGLAPENTLASMQRAIKEGIDWIEFDVHHTKDGQLVVLHDFTTGRIASTNLRVKNHTHKELRALKTNSGQPIPLLSEVLETIGDKAKINIEIKASGCAKGVSELIEKYIANGYSYDHFLVSSFSPFILWEMRRLNKNVPLAQLEFGLPIHKILSKALNLKAVGFDHKRMSGRLVTSAKKNGLFVYTYTVNDTGEAKKLEAIGIDAIVTNYPDRFNSQA